MPINKKLIHFERKQDFTGTSGLNNQTTVDSNGNVGNIPYRSIVFIKDTNEIWTHGAYYKGTDTRYTSQSFTIGGTAYNLYTSNNSGVNLDNLYSKAIKIVIDATNLQSLDVNTALSGGGAAYNYSSITKWINAPTDMKYGQIIQLTEKDLLGAQLAFESGDSTYAAGRLWYRTYRTAERPQGQSSIQAWGEWAQILTDKNISDFAMTSHQTFTELNTKLSSAGEVGGIRNSQLKHEVISNGTVTSTTNVNTNANLAVDDYKAGIYFIGPISVSGGSNFATNYGSAIRVYRADKGTDTSTARSVWELFAPIGSNTFYFRNSWNRYNSIESNTSNRTADISVWNDWYEVYHEGNLKFNYNQTATDRKVQKDANNNLYVTIPNWIGSAAGSEHVPIYLNNSGIPTAITDIQLVNDNTSNKQISVQNNNGSVGIFVSSNRGLYDFTNSKWIIYNTKNDGNNNYHTYILKWKNIGSSTNPIYFNVDGEPQASTYSFTTTIPDGNSDDTTIPTSKAVWDAIDRGFDVNNALVFIGTYSGQTTSSTVKTGTGTFTPTFVNDDVKKGWVWIVSDITNGEYFGNIRIEIGDLIIAADDEPGTNISKYYLIQKNIDPTIYVTLATTQTITGQKTFNSTNTIFNKNVQLNGQTDIVSAQVGNLQVSGLTSFAQVAYGCTPDSTAENNELVTAEWINTKLGNYQTTDTKNTAGITNSTSTLYLIGTTTQTGTYAQTYSNSNVYITDGVLNLKASQYTDSKDTGSLDLHNSDIYGVNSIKFADLCNGAAEGLQWYRDETHIDSLWVKSGVIYFTPNREWGQSGTNYTVLNSSNTSISNNTITINGTSLTVLTEHQSLSNYLTDVGLATGKSTNGNTDKSLTNGNVYLKLFKNSSEDSKIKISGTSPISVTTDTNGDIAISANLSSYALASDIPNAGYGLESNTRSSILYFDVKKDFYTLSTVNNTPLSDIYDVNVHQWNIDTLITPGSYTTLGGNGGSTQKDYVVAGTTSFPTFSGGFRIYVQQLDTSNTGYYKQTLHSYSGKQYYRIGSYNGTTATWGNWNEILDSNNYTSYITPIDIGIKSRNLTIGGTNYTVYSSTNATVNIDNVYLQLSGGTISNSNYGPLTIKRSNTNYAGIRFENSNGALGSISMGAVNGPLVRWDATATIPYTVFDTENAKWANLSVSTSTNTKTKPMFGEVQITNSTSGSADTHYCRQVYDATNQCLKFIFV